MNWISIIKFNTVLILSVFLFSPLFGQKEGYIGIFGTGAGLNFNTDPVSVITFSDDSPIRFDGAEGCATICNREGELLFYTDGLNVWNRNHKLMPNGGSIRGLDFPSNSTTQCLIVAVPKDPHQYYVFTAGSQGGDLTYSLVDMRLSNGMGDVVFKNRILYTGTTEKLSLVKHASKKAVWLITHEYGTNKFRSYFIDELGIDTAYMESAIGEVHAVNTEFDPMLNAWVSRTNAIGYLKASIDGNYLACAVNGELGTLELLQFNAETGIVFNPIKLFEDPSKGSYGVEFSAEGSRLYHTIHIERF